MVLIGVFAWFYLVDPMSDPVTSSSVAASAHDKAQNLANPGNPAGDAEP